MLLFPGGIVVLRELIRRLLILRHLLSLIPASSASSSRRAIGIVVRIVSLLVTITGVTVLLLLLRQRPGVVLLVVRIKRILSSSAGVGVHFPKDDEFDVIGGAFFSAQSIVQRKAHRKKRTTTTTTTTVLDRSKLDAPPQSSLLRKKGKGDALQSTVYRKDEEWELVSENEEADFLRIEFFFECSPSFQNFSSLNCTNSPL